MKIEGAKIETPKVEAKRPLGAVSAVTAEAIREALSRHVTPEGPDRVSLSADVAKRHAVERKRIEAIKAAITDGTYELDLDRLAQAVLDREEG